MRVGKNTGLPRRVSPHAFTYEDTGKVVFAVEVDGLGDRPLPGVANVGSRPTVQGVQARCETHLLNFSGDIYGRRLRVRFLKKLRDEQRFPSLEALKAAIEADVAAGHQYFAV